MALNIQTTFPKAPGRVTSVDFFRGLTMFLLAGEASNLYSHLMKVDSSTVQFIAGQFHHHEWHGLHFWDLIQPFFMFIVGMNCIFIYLFFETAGAGWISRIVSPFSELLFSWAGEMTTKIMTSLGVWAAMWYMCYWLYKNKMFIKI